MPVIILGTFETQLGQNTITFTASEEGAKIIDRVVHDIDKHDSLKDFPAEILRDFLRSSVELQNIPLAGT